MLIWLSVIVDLNRTWICWWRTIRSWFCRWCCSSGWFPETKRIALCRIGRFSCPAPLAASWRCQAPVTCWWSCWDCRFCWVSLSRQIEYVCSWRYRYQNIPFRGSRWFFVYQDRILGGCWVGTGSRFHRGCYWLDRYNLRASLLKTLARSSQDRFRRTERCHWSTTFGVAHLGSNWSLASFCLRRRCLGRHFSWSKSDWLVSIFGISGSGSGFGSVIKRDECRRILSQSHEYWRTPKNKCSLWRRSTSCKAHGPYGSCILYPRLDLGRLSSFC